MHQPSPPRCANRNVRSFVAAATGNRCLRTLGWRVFGKTIDDPNDQVKMIPINRRKTQKWRSGEAMDAMAKEPQAARSTPRTRRVVTGHENGKAVLIADGLAPNVKI